MSEAEWGIREGDGQAAYIAMRTGTAGRETAGRETAGRDTAGGTASVWASRANPWRISDLRYNRKC